MTADQWPETGLVFTTLAGTAYEQRNFNRRFETRCAGPGSVVSPSTTPGSSLQELCGRPTALAARVAVVRIGSAWTGVGGWSSLDGSARW